MNFIERVIKRPIAALTITLLVFLIGAVSLWKAPLDLLPEIKPPFIAVITVFPGSSPQETLKLVTEPIEEHVAAIGGITGLSSLSQENISMVLLKFHWGSNLDSLRDEIGARLDLLTLPDEVRRPIILKFDPTLLPVMQVNVSGDRDDIEMTEWLKRDVKPRLEQVQGVAAVEVQGGVEEDLFVRLKPDKVAMRQVSFEQVSNILRASLLDLPAGITELEESQMRLRFLGRPKAVTDLTKLVVGFQLDEEALQKLLGNSIDLNLNRILSEAVPSLPGEGMPMRTIYLKDAASGVRIDEANNNLVIAVDDNQLRSWGFEKEQLVYLLPARLNPFTVDEGIALPIPPREILDWTAIGNIPLLQLPDFTAWFKQIQEKAGEELDQLSTALTQMASSMIAASAGGGLGSSIAAVQGDIPLYPITLGSIAEIELDRHSPTSITRVNGKPSISLVIQKEGEANTVAVSRQVRQALAEIAKDSQARERDASFLPTYDQAREIENALADLAWSLVGGALLAVTVLLFFLRSWRTVAIIGITIPIAIVATFSLLFFSNLTINLMTLGALALAAGMLVDNAIIVSENIYRHFQMGANPAEAAVKGSSEVAGAILASTLTTISVFVPVAFISGLARELFRDFAITVSSALAASLIVALTLIPLLASRFLRRRRFKGDFMPKQSAAYSKILERVIRRPWVAVAAGAAVILLGAALYPQLGTNLFPSPEESSFYIDISLPPGSTLQQTDEHVIKVEEVLAKMQGISNFTSRIGEADFFGLPIEGGNPNKARITVSLKPDYAEEVNSIMDEIRRNVEGKPTEVGLAFNRMSLLDAVGMDAKLEMVVEGDDLERVNEISEQLLQHLSSLPQVTGAKSLLEETKPEMHAYLAQNLALQRGVTAYQVATVLRHALEGLTVARMETEQGIYNLVLCYEKEGLDTLEDLQKISFYTPTGSYLQLGEVATFTRGAGPTSIPRENQRVVGIVEAQYRGDLGGLTGEAMSAVEGMELPEGYTVRTTGTASMMWEVFDELELVLLMAALLVYLVMAAQFESLLHPLIIILSLPLAFSGSIISLLLTGSSLSVPALIGAVVLSGILVNDGILMVDFINQQRRIHGLPLSEAIVKGASARLRPIMMTTITTILGLVPLALGLGEGSQLQAPMAVVIIGGQITGTALLLLIIPAVYKLVTTGK